MREMTKDRFTYHVVDLKAGMWGLKAAKVQEELNRLGAQGWELVSAQPTPGQFGMRLILKRES
jgi:hypothetical protein